VNERRLRPWRQRQPTGGGVHRETFRAIYENDTWRVAAGSSSGPGSGLARTAGLRPALVRLLDQMGARSLLDAGCGDFHWMQAADLKIGRYIGIDVVPELVASNQSLYGRRGRRFLCRDLTTDRLPRADVVLCRDCLIHFPDDDLWRAVANIRSSRSTWLLATTFVDRALNEPIALGDWRPLNLQAPPFYFPEAELLIPDIPVQHGEIYADKRLGLWRLADLIACEGNGARD
jgi:SAM-dependent methyltransferase